MSASGGGTGATSGSFLRGLGLGSSAFFTTTGGGVVVSGGGVAAASDSTLTGSDAAGSALFSAEGGGVTIVSGGGVAAAGGLTLAVSVTAALGTSGRIHGLRMIKKLPAPMRTNIPAAIATSTERFTGGASAGAAGVVSGWVASEVRSSGTTGARTRPVSAASSASTNAVQFSNRPAGNLLRALATTTSTVDGSAAFRVCTDGGISLTIL